MNVIGWILDKKWAMLQASLESLIAIAQRNTSFNIDSTLFHKSDYDIDPENSNVLLLNRKEALMGDEGYILQGTQDVIMRGSVAVLPVLGPIFPRSNVLTRMSGATSLQSIASDFNTALKSDDVNAIVLEVDSPGGEVTDVMALGELIYQAREVKPVVAFVTGMAASAGFWVASSANKIFSSKTGEVGSIGVVAGVTDTSEKDAKEGVQRINIVSSISPNKRPDFKTAEGRQGVQKIVDDLGIIFAETVARNRGVTKEDVIVNYGQGGMLLADDALKTGMIDGISSLDNVIASLNRETNSPLNGGLQMSKKVTEATAADIKAENPDVYNEIVASGKTSTDDLEKAKAEGFEEGRKAENERIKGIEEMSSTDTSDIIAEHKFNMEKTKEDVAVAIVEGQKKKEKAKADAVTSDAGDAKVDVDTSTASDDAGEKRKEAASNIAAGMNAFNQKKKQNRQK